MFLEKRFIYGKELAEKMGMHIANISMLKNDFNSQDDYYTVQKKGSVTFIDAKSSKLPENIKNGIQNNEFTDMSNRLPCSWVHKEYGLTEKELLESGIVCAKEKICGKNFYLFSYDFVKKMKNKIGYVLSKKEVQDCESRNEILGSLQLKRNKFFVWY